MSLPRKRNTQAREAVRDAVAFVHEGVPQGAMEGSGLYRLLVDSVTDYAIFALSADGHILSWNSGARRIKGYEASEIIGSHIERFYPPEDREAGKPAHLLGIAAKEGHVEDIGWRVRKDGTRFWASVVITALHDESGALVGYAKVTRDLTERKLAEEALRRSEERFRLIVQSVKDYGIFMLDPKGIVVSWNEGAENISGYRADEIIGDHFSRFYPQEDLEWDKPGMELRVAVKEGRFEDEGWRVRKDGSLFWANVIITPVYQSSGDLLGFAKVTRDLSERRAAEERAVNDAKRIASVEASNRAKADFLAAMSHELRTPLNAIGGYAELLQMGVGGQLGEQQLGYIERVRAAQQHLLTLINDLLNYSKIEAGQVVYDMTPLRLHDVVQHVVTLIEGQATRKQIALTHENCHDEVIALADRVKTEQVLLNLVSNAIKFTPSGGSVIARCVSARDMVGVVVEDSGPGVPKEHAEAIFEPFVQLGRSLTSTHEGTWLWLAISRDLTRAMGGDISVSPSSLGGAAFKVRFRKA